MIINDYVVYSHTRIDTNEVFYIGKGKLSRVNRKGRCDRSKYWHRVVNKAGGFCSTVEAKNLTERESLNYEILLIKKLKEAGFKLCNITDGGDGVSGLKHTEESKRLMSIAHKGRASPTKGVKFSPERIEKMRCYLKGTKQSDEHKLKTALGRAGIKCSEATKEKLRIINTGKKMSREAILKRTKAVRCIDTGIEYESVTLAANTFGLSTSNISKACKGQFSQTGGMRWEYTS